METYEVSINHNKYKSRSPDIEDVLDAFDIILDKLDVSVNADPKGFKIRKTPFGAIYVSRPERSNREIGVTTEGKFSFKDRPTIYDISDLFIPLEDVVNDLEYY